MKNFIKRFTAVIAAVLIFCISVFSSSFRVSADSALDYFSSGSVYGSLPDDFPTFVNDSVSALLSCQDFTADNYYIVCYYYHNQSFIGVFDSTWFNSLNGYNFSYDPKTREFHGFSVLSNYSLFYEPGFTVDSSLVSSTTYLLVTDSSNNFYISHYITSTSIKIDYQITDYIVFSPGCFSAKPVDPDQPSSSKLPLYGVKVGIDKKGFLEWLITEGKESVINSTGFNFTQKQLSLLVDVFDSYGNNSFWFYSSLVKTFKLTQHSLTGASALLSTLQELYRDYLDYKNSIEIVEITPDDSAKPHWRQDKTDNTLVTDQDDDTSVVSILREILRTLIYLPSSIRSSFSDLATNIVSIMYNWNRLFDYLNNLEFPSVEIPDNTSFLEYLFKPTFSDFDNLESEVKEKFPILSQIEAVPDPDEVIIESNQIVSYSSTSDSADSDQPVLPSFEAENVYNNDFLFSFEVPEDSTFLNGSVTGVKVPFASFSKLLPAIEAFKGIISVIAIAAFSNWLIKFAPKLMHGYSSGD